MRKEWVGAAAVLGLALLGLSAAAGAVETEASIGISIAGSNDATAAAFVEVAGERRTGGRFTWQPIGTLGFVRGRDVRDDLDRDVVIAGIGARFVDWWRSAFFSVEVAHATRTTAAISSHGQFVTSLGWKGEHHVVAVRHISNADLGGGKNLGETMLLAGVAF